MRLLVDIGNTRVKWIGVAADQAIPKDVLSSAEIHHRQFPACFERCFGSGSDFAKQLAGLKVSNLMVSNVAGRTAAESLQEFAVHHWSLQPQFVQVEREFNGIQNGYQVLSELGVDRWVAVLGARQVFSEGHVVIVNCGTAITVDVLDAHNRFVGGAILPGFQLATQALSSADGIAKIEPSTIDQTLGTRTHECVQLGVIAACVGGVEMLIRKIQSQYSVEPLQVLVSGGAAPLFLDASSLECEYDANVIMRGLNRIIECES